MPFNSGPRVSIGYAPAIGMARNSTWATSACSARPMRSGVCGRGAPAIHPALPVWQVLHLLLYAFLIVMPVLGLLTAWTDGKALHLPISHIAVPALLPPRLEDLHGSIASSSTG
jgi:hypothetical protein